MLFAIALLIILSITFFLVFKLVHKGNKEEPEKERINIFLVLFITALFTLIITGVIAVFLFAVLGSTSVVNLVFSLDISTGKLFLLAIVFLIYLFTVDSLIELVIKYILGENMLLRLVMFMMRSAAFYLIGSIAGLTDHTSFILALGVSVIVLIFEILYDLKEKSK
ncbi:hypothetical protein [Gracilibacillus alcaliphilus]|uniref:hypothetical protein n=1 Tax=Gracilibacillus alcaliphilus TaxID=1401441 RepID=UPI0019577CC4|nr:hypothetical protein [Gracilibacillus alcaliphilus]MBM7676382.1 heme/copper-type cytochrome/quinol oxidase subunit 2 [Gracilibacillus alcaliphilus]